VFSISSCERVLRSRFTLREEGQVELLGTPANRLSASATLPAADRQYQRYFHESLIPVPQTRSAFPPHALRNAFRRHDVRSATKQRSMGEILVHGNGARLFFASSAPCVGVVSNLEKLPIRRQSFLSATIAEGKVGLNQSDHLFEASKRMHVYELRPRKDHRGVEAVFRLVTGLLRRSA